MAIGTIDDVKGARRILTFGVCGSGKSTLAEAIAGKLALPYISVDDLCWEPGWVSLPPDEIDRRVLPRLAAEQYVIDSVYGRHNAAALGRVDVVVALDYPRLTSLWRLVRRTWRRVVRREACCNGNYESFARVFRRDSIIRWHFTSFRSKRSRMRTWHAGPATVPVVLLKRPRDAEALLAHL